MVKVYGYSDDVVTIEGGSYLEEIGCFDRDVRICFWDHPCDEKAEVRCTGRCNECIRNWLQEEHKEAET